MRRILFVILILVPTTGHAFSALVLSCHDGDSCTVWTGVETIHVRFADIDAPEIGPGGGQPFGRQAHTDLVELIKGKTVDVEARGTDVYGRTIATVMFGDLNVNEALVEAGDAWVYPKYCTDAAMPRMEAGARSMRRGLWAGSSPEPPWEWRHARRR